MAEKTLHLELENIGGIKRKITLRGGPTFIRGPNAANKSSLLRGLLFALGSVRFRSRSWRTRLAQCCHRTRRKSRGSPAQTDNGVENERRSVDQDQMTSLSSSDSRRYWRRIRFEVPWRATNYHRAATERADEYRVARRAGDENAPKRGSLRKSSLSVMSTTKLEDRQRGNSETKRERLDELESKLEELYDGKDDTDSDDAVPGATRSGPICAPDEAGSEAQIEQLRNRNRPTRGPETRDQRGTRGRRSR